MTPAAVSHQVKSLEAHLGVKLFRRVSRGLALTAAGRTLLPPLSEGLDQMEVAVERVKRTDGQRPVTVSVAPSFGVRWLVPRLDRLRVAHPELDIRIDANPSMVDLERDDIDVAIRYGSGNYPGLHVERLMEDEVVPVCSPELLKRGPALESPDDLAGHVLLHHEQPGSDDSYPDWRMWLLAAGAHGVDASRGPRFTWAGLAVQAALDGQGVALVGRALISNEVAHGRLVQPFEMSMPLSFAYWVVCPPRIADLPRIKMFREWLQSEAAG